MDLNNLGSIIDNLSEDDISALKGVASSLLSGGTHGENSQQPSQQQAQQVSGLEDIDLESLAKIASVMSMLSENVDDDRCNLLNALKPFLHEERRSKVDEAAKMLRVLDFVPKLREQGLLNL